MSHQFKLCEKCVQRHCNKQPTIRKGSAMGHTSIENYTCVKFRKHQTGFKLEEVYHEKAVQNYTR